MKRLLPAGPLLPLLPLLLLWACANAPVRAPREPRRAPSAWEGEATVRTRYGLARGLEDRDGTWVWRALPYARPPVGELRWKAPQDPRPWNGVRTRYFFARPGVQFRPLTGRLVGTEDCLYLNVWRPRSAEAGLPVYVWIHGGGNSIGSATYAREYLGYRLAAGGNLVFVSVNYRLGPMGWFSHPALREGRSAEDDSGNFGTLDLIQALRWVRDNIAAFGGDPQTVTIAGESAGAMNVLSLLICPPAAGLFQRAVIQSGLAVARSPEEGERAAGKVILRLLERTGRARNPQQAAQLLAGMAPSQLRAWLRSLPAREILRCYPAGRAGMIDNPSIFADGTVLPADGFAALERGGYLARVPVLIGSNREELKMFLFLAGDPPWRSELYALAARYGSERWRADGVDAVARRLAARPGQPAVYAYLFAWGSPDAQGRSPLPGNWGRRLGAFHSAEIPFFLGAATPQGALFGPLLFTEANRAGREALSAAMRGYLTAFLRTGDPNADGTSPGGGEGAGGAGAGGSADGGTGGWVVAERPLPFWTPWSNDPGEPKTMLLDARGDEPELRMLPEELTREGIEAAMREELSPGQLQAVLAILDRPLVGRERRPQ
jgi:para-nitrobenzyl esterase